MKRIISFTVLGGLVASLIFAGAVSHAGAAPAQINFVQGTIAFEFVGQATAFAPTSSAPLASANQYGFLTVVRGIDDVFRSSPHDETTALLTFFNEATTTESFPDGPLRIIHRNGTTTIYLNTAPASFANPDSFRSGIPVQTSTLHQQAVNTAGGYIYRRVRKHRLVDEGLHH